jgi:signal transduction histidine kinase
VLSSRTYTRADGLAQNTVFATYASRNGEVWAGTISGGLSRLKDGAFTNYSMSNGLSSNAVNSIVEGYDGTVWVGTSAGLDAFRKGDWSHWSRADGLPSSEVRNCFEDSQHVLWLLTASGIAYLSSGKLVVPNHIPEALRDPLFGITEDGLGVLWLSTSDHVIRVNRGGLLADTLHETDVQIMGEQDGLAGPEGVRRDHSILTCPDGRIWVSVQNGIAVTDPALYLRQSTPVSVRIESITASGTIFRTPASFRIPARTRSVTFQFSGASLDSPERIWYRFLLEGADQTWSDPVQMRQVGYNNLHSGAYRFRVIASHDGALWNGPETDAAFTIDQAFWETWWFRTGWLFLAGVTLLLVIRLRMLRLSSQLNARFQERLAERTRIARELHDTLLQSLHGLMFQFQAVRNMLPRKPEDAMQTLDEAISETEQAIAESRDAIHDLRSQPISETDLPALLETAGEELAAAKDTNQNSPRFRVIVEGEAKKLSPDLQDEAYRIARELLRNAFRHAGADLIEAEIRYDKNQLRLRIRDDGKGIDPKVLDECRRPGHWGLPGVHERAQSIGSQLSFWSQTGAGTEVELTIPAAVAYQSTRDGHRFKVFRKEQKP